MNSLIDIWTGPLLKKKIWFCQRNCGQEYPKKVINSENRTVNFREMFPLSSMLNQLSHIFENIQMTGVCNTCN
uniref:Uncharacterized protein n=1 Tax=Utricularia reniformis TaxID=192314 RepID=A0A1Y0B4V4_9LAMI|nr:hypothetical protein AEK19_MT2223 [Utricularia reniformis]ART32369.1 hypothetical protein AEK19_MT2223 [Utricularia reniformis]